MESNHAQGPASARDALRGLECDRLELARRTRSPRWYYPGLALFTAAIPLAPLAEGVWVFVIITFACLGIVGLERAFVLTTGISTNRVPGPRSLIVLVVMGIVVLTMVFVSGLAVDTDSTAWALTAGAVSFLVMFPGGYVYDHFYGQELRRGV